MKVAGLCDSDSQNEGAQWIKSAHKAIEPPVAINANVIKAVYVFGNKPVHHRVLV